MVLDVEPAALDGGWAWFVLLGSFTIEVLLAGFAKGIGTLFVEWQVYFDVGATDVGWVGICLAFAAPTAGMVSAALTSRFGSRLVAVCGAVGTSIMFIVMSCAQTLWQLYISGLFLGVFMGLAYQPAVTVINFYFQKKIGMANGIAYSGVGVGVIIIPPLLQVLSNKYDWRGATQITAALMLLLVLAALMFRPSEREKYFMSKKTSYHRMKMEARRQSVHENNQGQSAISLAWNKFVYSSTRTLGLNLLWKYPRFGNLCTAFSLVGYGEYAALVFFSSRAVFDLGLTKLRASYLISTIGIGSAIIRAAHGVILDLKIISATSLFTISCYMTALSNFMNPLSHTFVSLLCCAIVFGVATGLVYALFFMCVREMVPPEFVGSGFGVALLCNGVGAIVGIFLMGYLYDVTQNFDWSFISAGIVMVIAACLMTIDVVHRKCSNRRDTQQLPTVSDDDGDAQMEPTASPTEQEQKSAQMELTACGEGTSDPFLVDGELETKPGVVVKVL